MTGLIGFLVLVLIVGLLAGLFIYLVNIMPFIPGTYKQAVHAIIIVIAIIIILVRGLPLAGVGLV